LGEVGGVGTAMEVETAMWMIGMMVGVMVTETVLTPGKVGMAAVGVIAMAVIVMAVIGTHLLAIATMEAVVEVTGMEVPLTVILRMDMGKREAMIGMVQGVAAVTGTGPAGPCVMKAVEATGRGQHPMIVLVGEGALRPMIADNCMSTHALLLS